MTKIELNQIYLQLQREINQMGHSVDLKTRNLIKNDAKDAILMFKSEIDDWFLQLYERKISCYELENLLKSSATEQKLSGLRKNYKTDSEFDEFKITFMRIIAKSISNTFLDNLFNGKYNSKRNENIVYKL